MSELKDINKLPEKGATDSTNLINYDDTGASPLTANEKDGIYTVTISKKASATGEGPSLCSGQKSFISIHSTDQPCEVNVSKSNVDVECNVELLSLNEVFPSTSEDSLSNEDEPSTPKKKLYNKESILTKGDRKPLYAPTNSKSTTVSRRQRDTVEGQPPAFSSMDIPKNTLYVIGSNPGEPKMSYQDPPKKISKTMKKFLRNIDKHKTEMAGQNTERAISKLTMRGILKDGRCDPESTGDTVNGDIASEDISLAAVFDPQANNYNYTKQNPDKNVTFNRQVVIIHFTGDLCVGQSVETLSKEKDQQARNSELRKTFLTKYNEFWPTQK